METKSKTLSLWYWVAAAFLLLLTAWSAMFFFATQNRVASVPVETR